MARRPDQREAEMLSEENLNELRRSLAHLSLPARKGICSGIEVRKRSLMSGSLPKKAEDFQFRHQHLHFFQNEHELLDLWPARLKELLRLNGLACTLEKNC
jgi:hypothetical protein